MTSKRRTILIVGLMLAVAVPITIFTVTAPEPSAVPVEEVSLTELLNTVAEGAITDATLFEAAHRVEAEVGDEVVLSANYPLEFSDELLTALIDAEVPVETKRGGTGNGWALLTAFVPLLIIGVFALLIVRMAGKNGRGPGSFGKVDGTPAEVPSVTFDDLAGIDEVVDEAREVVDYLRDPARFAKVGAKLPSGFLLCGPPGTGKTLLAKAIAAEASVPCLSMSGSDFVEMYVGVGAARVRDLFKKARAAERGAIIFIDEIDAIGKSRSAATAPGGNDEREATLNALLVEMDGFTTQKPVFVLGATNRPDQLDSALLRPGRFDRRITVDLPDRAGREKILRLHLTGKPMSAGVDVAALARRCTGFSGAELANLANQAALVAARGRADQITGAHLEEAFETVTLGPARRSAEQHAEDLRIVAWHEAGHALTAALQEHADPVETITIVPRGRTGGATWFGGSDRALQTRSVLLARLVVAMGGRAAEELLLDGDFTSGAAGDYQQATQLAESMVAEWGMGALPGNLRDRGRHDETISARDGLLHQALADARRLLGENRALLEELADELLREETVSGQRLGDLIAQRKTRTLRPVPEVPAVQVAAVTTTPPAPRTGAALRAGRWFLRRRVARSL